MESEREGGKAVGLGAGVVINEAVTVLSKDGSRAIQDVQLTGRIQLSGLHGMCFVYPSKF